LIFGGARLSDWPPGDDHQGTSEHFVAARRACAASNNLSAQAIWREITTTEGLESRDYLQAWSFLREGGLQPQEADAKRVLGVVVEMPMQGATISTRHMRTARVATSTTQVPPSSLMIGQLSKCSKPSTRGSR
jgi:hypothetical protein